MNSASFQQLVQGGNFTANQTYTQVIEWVDFIGGNMFCLKMCNPSDPEAALLCQHIYDEIGCTYNAVADYPAINGTFEVCDSDDMAFPGIFSTNGALTTWTQPFSGEFSVPYQTSSLASSNCVTYSSEQLFAAVATDSIFATTTASGAAASGSGASGSRSGSGAGSTGTSGGSSSGGSASAAIESNVLPYLVIGFFSTVATMFTILA